MEWVFLSGAILVEVAGTLSLRMAVTGHRAWYTVVGAAYVLAFTLFSFALQEGIGLGVAYGIWTASGVALTAVGSRVFFAEALTPLMVAGIGLIATGVLLVELGSAPHR